MGIFNTYSTLLVTGIKSVERGSVELPADRCGPASASLTGRVLEGRSGESQLMPVPDDGCIKETLDAGYLSLHYPLIHLGNAGSLNSSPDSLHTPHAGSYTQPIRT